MDTFELDMSCDHTRPDDNNTTFESSTLYAAIKSHDSSRTLREIYNGADIHARDASGRTWLHLVASEGADTALLPTVYQLSNAGAEIDAEDDAGTTPLEAALRADAQLTVAALLRVGADPRLRDYRAVVTGSVYRLELWDTLGRYTPGLWAAVERDDAASTQLLVSSWCRVCVSRGGVTLVQAAREAGASRAVMATLHDYDVTLEFVHAVLAGDERRMVEFLMDSKPCDPYIMDVTHQASWSAPLTPRSLRDTAVAMGHAHVLPHLPEDDLTAHRDVRGYHGGLPLDTVLKYHGNQPRNTPPSGRNKKPASKTRPMKAFPHQVNKTPDIIAHNNDNNNLRLDILNSSLEDQVYEQSKFGSVGLRSKSKARKGLREVYSFHDDWLMSDTASEDGPLTDCEVKRIETMATPRPLSANHTPNTLSKDYSKNWTRSSLKASLSKSRARTKEIRSKMCVIS